MQRAKDFDEKSQRAMNSSRLEGQLSKWTNALKGWQNRWLSVDQQQGVLHYYTSEERKKAPPRGSLHLWGAVIAPSDEDSQTFTVNGANGEVYKLRAADAKERQYWVSRLRNEIERCTSAHAGFSKTQVQLPNTTSATQHTPTISSSPLSPITTNTSVDKTAPLSLATPLPTPTRKQSRGKGRGLAALASRASLKKRSSKSRRSGRQRDQEEGLPGGEAMLELLTRLMEYQTTLTTQLESCSGTGVNPVDENVLLLRATSEAAVHTVKDCLALIKLQQTCPTVSGSSLPGTACQYAGGGEVTGRGEGGDGSTEPEDTTALTSSPTRSTTVTTV